MASWKVDGDGSCTVVKFIPKADGVGALAGIGAGRRAGPEGSDAGESTGSRDADRAALSIIRSEYCLAHCLMSGGTSLGAKKPFRLGGEGLISLSEIKGLICSDRCVLSTREGSATDKLPEIAFHKSETTVVRY